jgi:hypothetical protein
LLEKFPLLKKYHVCNATSNVAKAPPNDSDLDAHLSNKASKQETPALPNQTTGSPEHKNKEKKI